jgi:N-acetylmuramoyl-L-alanine amidase
VRVGQFDTQTTRIVIELAPGYTLDPQQIKFVGITPSRWTVQLPTPVAENRTDNPEIAQQPPPDLSPRDIYKVTPTNGEPEVNTVAAVTQIENLQVTGDGFFVRTRGGNPQIQINRTEDQQVLNIDLAGASLSPNFQQQDFAINRYGVNRIQFTQLQNKPQTVRMTMLLDKNSPDWRVSTSSVGGFVVLPNRNTVRLPREITQRRSPPIHQPPSKQWN